jgi:paraquat-inducible protein A
MILGLFLPVLELRRGLSDQRYSVLTGIVDLAKGGNLLLALIVFAFSVVFPIAKLASLCVALFGELARERRQEVLRRLELLGRWSMLDVFVIAVLVGSVQLGVLSEGRALPGIYVFGAAILLSMVSTVAVHNLSARSMEEPGDLGAVRQRSDRWRSAAAAALFLVGLCLPLMQVEKWVFWDNQYSVLAATWKMASSGQVPLAATVLVFVVLLPALRLIGLCWLQWGHPSPGTARAVLLVDRWAMLDVFGLALLIVAVKIGDIAAVEARPGLWVLLAAVCLSAYDSWKLQRRAA